MSVSRTPNKKSADEAPQQNMEELIDLVKSVDNAAEKTSSLAEVQFLELMCGIKALHEVVNDLRNDANTSKQEIDELKKQLRHSTTTSLQAPILVTHDIQEMVATTANASSLISANYNAVVTKPPVSYANASSLISANYSRATTEPIVSNIQPIVSMGERAAAQSIVNCTQRTLPTSMGYTQPIGMSAYNYCTLQGANAMSGAQASYFVQSTPHVMHNQQFTPSFTEQIPTDSLPYTQPSQNNRATHNITITENSHLLPLPTFGGDPEDWPLFLVNFTESTNELGYTNRQNLVRLHKALQGNARQAVSSMLIYPDEVPNIINELQFNFGRPELMIKAQLEKIQSLHAITENRMDLILVLSNKVQNITAFFKAAKCEHHLANPLLMEQIIGKLPPSKQYEWSKYVVTLEQIKTFAEWIGKLARVVAIMPSSSQPVHTTRNSTASGTMRRVLHSNEIKQEQKCVQCEQNHSVSKCKQFLSLEVSDRWNTIRHNNLCFGCLRRGHNITYCRSKKICGIDDCKRYHHELLHQKNIEKLEKQTNVERVLSCRNEQNNHDVSLYKMIQVCLSGPNGKINIWAMLDEGSSVTLLEEEVARKLGITGQSVPLILQWIGHTSVTERSNKVGVEISGLNNEKIFYMRNVYTVKSLQLPTQTFHKQNYEHLKGVALNDYTDVIPSLLIGLDNSYLAVPTRVICDGPCKPIAAETMLGWVVFGPTNAVTSKEARVLHLRKTHTLDQLGKLVEDNYAIENFGAKVEPIIMDSDENIRAKEILMKTTKKIGDRYEVGLLWKADSVDLPNNYKVAEQRLLLLEAKMQRNPAFASKYKAEIDKYLHKNYARALDPEEASRENSTIWYLPHFGVINPYKPEKLKVVFDAAATMAGISLNSALLKGPEQVKSLLGILYKFRQGTVAVAGDVQEMFSQIKIIDEDQKAQRFLWRNGNTNQIEVFTMTTMIFGAACSPCCAEFIKNYNANQHKSLMPKGANAVLNNMYVDDLVISYNGEEEALRVTKEAIHINAAAGFNLRNFVSNSRCVQESLNGCEARQSIKNMEPETSPDKILGMYWNTANDNFEFHFKFHRVAHEVLMCTRTPTKRELLGIAMSIYDPFGFLANITISIKLILQATWKLKIQWDDKLTEELSNQWYEWWHAFQAVKHFVIPRCYSHLLPVADQMQLHMFVDASSSAYAAVAYLRIKKGEEIHVVLLGSKSRCAPLKLMTTPRMELQAAVLGSRFSKAILNSLDFQVNDTVFWSDSNTVVQWIKSTTRQFKQFVAHRISEITTLTCPNQWRWLPTKLNIADEATRLRVVYESENTCWVMGPEFLRCGELATR